MMNQLQDHFFKFLGDPSRHGVLCIFHDSHGANDYQKVLDESRYKYALDIQDMLQEQERDSIAVVLDDHHISVRYPNSDQWEVYDQGEDTTASDIIQGIDDDNEWGLEAPVFVFASVSALASDIPIRSEQRVPTHLAVSPRADLNACMQAVGRASLSSARWVSFPSTENGPHLRVLSTVWAQDNNKIWFLPGSENGSEEAKLDGHVLQEMTNDIVTSMPPQLLELIENCGGVDSSQSLIKTLVEALVTDAPFDPVGIEGRTQVQESAMMGITQAVCMSLKCPLVVVTQGTEKSLDLSAKLRGLAAEDCTNLVVSTRNSQSLVDALFMGGTVVANDSEAQLSKVIGALQSLQENEHGEGHKFVLLVDQLVGMYGTADVDRQSSVEVALNNLMAMKPVVKVIMSAAPINGSL